MRKFTKHDVKVFLLGMLAMLLITLIYDWNDFADGFNAGFNGRSAQETKSLK